MALPTFLIVGAMKAGTTSLHGYLKAHPDIFMSHEKEVDFFFQPERFKKGIEWYSSLFDANYEIRGESSPNYTKRPELLKEIKRSLPNIKLIYLTRNPIERFLSECNHLQLDPNKIVESTNFQNKQVFKNSLFYSNYMELLKYYSKDNVLVVKSENLRGNQQETLKEIFGFLEANPLRYDFDNKVLSEEKHITANKPLNSNFVLKVNKNNTLNSGKKVLAIVFPFFKPLWKKLVYKKRVIRKLTDKNHLKLKLAYKAEMQELNKELNINYDY